jgi:Flp pilus assembly protein TadD
MEAKTIGGRWSHIAFLLVLAIPVRCIAQQLVCIEESSRRSLRQGQFKEAEKELRRVLATGQPCPEAHFLLAYTLLRQNLPRESLAEYTAAARLRTPAPEDLRNVALDYVLLGDYPDADHWIQRALLEDANDSETWYVLGRIRYNTGKFQDAIRSFEHTLLLSPGNVKAENNLGLAYEGLNEVDKAMDAYRRAIAFGEQSGKQSEQPLINLSILLAHHSDLDGALALLQRARTLAPEDASVREHLGHVYLERNELPLAQVELEKAVSLSPLDARLHYLLGQVYRREGLGDKANFEFVRSASLNGTKSTPDHLN